MVYCRSKHECQHLQKSVHQLLSFKVSGQIFSFFPSYFHWASMCDLWCGLVIGCKGSCSVTHTSRLSSLLWQVTAATTALQQRLCDYCLWECSVVEIDSAAYNDGKPF